MGKPAQKEDHFSSTGKEDFPEQPSLAESFSLNLNARQKAFNADEKPNGNYHVTIERCQLKPTSSGMGANVMFRINPENGKYVNACMFKFFNLTNANAQAAHIGQTEFATLAMAIGLEDVSIPGDLPKFEGRKLIVTQFDRKDFSKGQRYSALPKE